MTDADRAMPRLLAGYRGPYPVDPPIPLRAPEVYVSHGRKGRPRKSSIAEALDLTRTNLALTRGT